MKHKKSKFKIGNIFKSKIVKFSLLFLSTAAITSFVLTGCDKNKRKESKDVIEISFYSHKAENDEAIKKIASDFQKTHNNIKITVSTLGGSADYLTNLKSEISSGRAPDIFNYSSFGEMQDFLPYLKTIEEKDMPILKEMDERWLACAKDFNGDVKGLTECVEGFGYVANTAMFKAAGVDPGSLRNWKGIEEGCAKLEREIKNPNSEVKKKFPNINSVWLLALQEAWIQGNHGFTPFINMDFYTEDGRGLDPAINPIHKAYREKELPGKGFSLYKKYIDFIVKYAQDNYSSANYSTIIDGGLLTKTGAITQQGTWLMNKIKEFDKTGANIGKELELLPFSTPGGKTDNKYVIYPGQFFGISKDVSEEKYKAIKEFLEYFFKCEEYTKDCDFISPLKNSNQVFSDSNNFNNAIQKAIKENNIIPGDLSVIRTEDFHKNTIGTALQKYAAKGSDFSEKSWNEIIVTPAKKKWTEIYERQKSQKKN